MSDLTDAIEAAAPRLTVALWNLAHGRGHALQGPPEAAGARNTPDAYPDKGPGVPDAHRAAQTDDRDDRQEQ